MIHAYLIFIGYAGGAEKMPPADSVAQFTRRFWMGNVRECRATTFALLFGNKKEALAFLDAQQENRQGQET